jgi:hypothetical protein
MGALFFLLLIVALAIAAEGMLWVLFTRSAAEVDFQKPLAPSFFHVSRKSRMALLASLHLTFTVGMLCLAFFIQW